MEPTNPLMLQYPMCTNKSCETPKLLGKSEEGLARFMQGSGFYTQHKGQGAGKEKISGFLYFSNIKSLLATLVSSI